MADKRIKMQKMSVFSPYPYLYSNTGQPDLKYWITDEWDSTDNSRYRVKSAEWGKQKKTKNSLGYEVQHGDEAVTQSSEKFQDLFTSTGVNIDWDDYYQWDNKCRAYNASFGLFDNEPSALMYTPMPICGFRFKVKLKGSTNQAIKQFQINEVVAHYREKRSAALSHESLDSNYYNDIKFRQFYGPDVEMSSEQKKNIKYDSFKALMDGSSSKKTVMATTKNKKFANDKWFPCAVTFSFFIDFWGGGSKEKYRVNISEFEFVPGNVENEEFIQQKSRIDALHGEGDTYRCMFDRKRGNEGSSYSSFYQLVLE